MRVLLGIFSSIIFHLLLALLLQQLPYELPSKQVVEIVVLDESSHNKTKQIVTDVKLPKNLLELSQEEQANLLSAYQQRVKKQMQAALTGASKNRSNKTTNDSAPAEPQEKFPDKLQLDPRKPGNLSILSPQYNLRMPKSISNSRDRQNSDFEKGLSTIGEALPMDIEVGSFTALNTNQSLFYTFYARVNEMIRFRWESQVRSAISNTPPDRWTYNPLGVWTTQLEVILDKSGVIREILLMKPSGFKSFDQAAIFAFRDSKSFLNPPIEMVNPEDGLIRLKYAFQVRYEPKVVVKSRE